MSTDEEQIEAIKRFIREQGTKILLSVVLVIALVSAYQYWKHSRITAQETASIYYSELANFSTESLSVKEKAKFDEIFTRLVNEYPTTRYTAYAALQKAKLEVQANALTEAEKTLSWAKAQSKEADTTALIAVRLARVYLAQEKYEQALTELNTPHSAYAAQFEETKGDVYLAQGQSQQAKVAYQKAKALFDDVRADTQLLAMKIQSIAAENAEKSE